jgi:hypothetical protein
MHDAGMYSHPSMAAEQAAQHAARLPAPDLVPARIHALAPGTWPADPVDLTITPEDIAATASAYDPARYRAPVVIGHPETDDPAWGWVLGASAQADGLWLDVELLPEMADLVRSRRYQAVSVALWTPDAPGNPTPGVWALKHLGFLGAAAPAVKGLAPVQLAAVADGQIVTVTLRERVQHRNPKEQSMSETDPSVAAAERERRLAEREAAIAARERELARAAYAAELDAHVRAGRVLPAECASLVAVMERLAQAEAVTLAEGGAQPALDLLRGFLARLPARVEMAERAGPAAADAPPPPRLPHGYRLSERGLDLWSRARAYQAQHPGVDILTAARAVERAA